MKYYLKCKSGGKKMIKCNECRKKLGFFEGYRHPTLGKENLLCSPCFDKVQQSVDQWREFILSNSFNSKSSIQRLNHDLNFMHNKVIEARKSFTKTEKKKNPYIKQDKICVEMKLSHLIFENNDTAV
jgi:hypothetical protein